MNTGVEQPSALIRLKEVQRRTGLGRSAIYEKAAIGTFPAPVKLGERASAWVEAEVTAWIDARIRMRAGWRALEASPA